MTGNNGAKRLVFFGDSICVGQHVSPHATWVVRAGAQLQQDRPELTSVNASVNGNTTRMALERMPFDVQQHRLDAAYIQFGMNDCNYWQTDGGLPRVSERAFAANLAEIIERVIRFGARAVLLGTNHPTPKTTRFAHADCSYQESNHRYSATIRDVATASFGRPVVVVDHERAWEQRLDDGAKLTDLLLDDAIHLSARGHDLYLETALPKLREVLGS